MSSANEGGTTESSSVLWDGAAFFTLTRRAAGGDPISYGEKVLSRLNVPGLALLILGAVLVYTSGPISGRLFPEKGDKANIAVKAAGCAVALVGALLLLDIIG